jgi:hypothetical protein
MKEKNNKVVVLCNKYGKFSFFCSVQIWIFLPPYVKNDKNTAVLILVVVQTALTWESELYMLCLGRA